MPGRISRSPRDPGLQPERTGLSWLRTAMSCLIVGLLCLREAIVDGEPLSLAAGMLAIVLSTVMTFRSMVRRRYDPDLEDVTSPESQSFVSATTMTILAIVMLEIARIGHQTWMR